MLWIYSTFAEFLGTEADKVAEAFALIGFTVSMLVPVLGFIATIYFYSIRRFPDQITYSANLLSPKGDGVYQLKLRTLHILPKGDLLPSNTFFNLRLMYAMWKCHRRDPFIRMSQADMDVLQPAIINGLSAQFADGVMARLVDGEYESQQFLLAVTFEKEDVKSQKIRVIVVTEKMLETITNLKKSDQISFERSHHNTRVRTLRQMAHVWQDEKESPDSQARVVRLFVHYL